MTIFTSSKILSTSLIGDSPLKNFERELVNKDRVHIRHESNLEFLLLAFKRDHSHITLHILDKVLALLPHFLFVTHLRLAPPPPIHYVIYE